MAHVIPVTSCKPTISPGWNQCFDSRESSLWNVLNTCHTSQRKAVRGLDDYTADDLNGSQALEEIVSSKIPEDLRKDYTNMLCNSKRYLKAQYIVSIADESNEVASHYRILALSEVDDDGSFSEECEHFHNKVCPECEALLVVLQKIKEAIPENDKEPFYEVEQARQSILERQRHIIRGTQQEAGKKVLLDMVNSNTVCWLRDWGMKILPEKYREAMQDWFGKRGISNNVDCIFYEDEADKTMKKATYYTTVDQCIQDANAALCVFYHVLNQIKSDFPLEKTLWTEVIMRVVIQVQL